MPAVNPFSSEGAGHPSLTEWQRQALMAIPYVGPAYGLARGIGAIYRGFGSLFHPGAPAGQLPTNTETNNPPMYASGAPAAAAPQVSPDILAMWQNATKGNSAPDWRSNAMGSGINAAAGVGGGGGGGYSGYPGGMGSYAQGTANGAGGGSWLQYLQALRQH